MQSTEYGKFRPESLLSALLNITFYIDQQKIAYSVDYKDLPRVYSKSSV